MYNNEAERGALLRTYKVTYAHGLDAFPERHSNIKMHLHANGFFFLGANFPPLWIPYNCVVEFKISKDGVSVWTAHSVELLNKRCPSILFINNNQIQTAVFEMREATIPMKNCRICQELVVFMNTQGIFDKFKSAQPQAPTSDIPTQIAKLAELHQAGMLTTDEFETKKTELLARM